jgi:choline dehydrogenase
MSVDLDPIRIIDTPTRLVHGAGALDRLGEQLAELGVTRPLLVTDPGVVAAGLAARALERLGDDAVVFAEARSNPDIELVDEAAGLYEREECDGLVAVGGGSPMDVAKAIGVVAAHGGSIADYEWGREPIVCRLPPLVTVPTTAGTGSEVTLWAVITDPVRGVKFNVGGTPLIAAHAAVIDPELMLGMPPAITAATGMDALAHAVECYTCDYHQFFNDAVALHAVELVATWLERAVRDGGDLAARTGMAHAATLGGMAYGTESAGAAHAMSQSAGGVHDCSHGALTARLLGPVSAFNAPASPERYARLARALGADVAGLDALEAALAGVRAIDRLTAAVGIPTLDELGFNEDEIPLLARISLEDPQTVGNPREIVGASDYEGIWRDAFEPRG